jgi:VanZ family protein
LQSLTPYRSAELADLVADALGALLAYFALRALASRTAPAPGAA